MIEGRVEEASVRIARRTSRRSFLARFGTGLVALAGGGAVAAALRPERAEAFHICGHTYTTGSCPHPYFPDTRIDHYGYPVHPTYGYPVDDKGNIYTSHQQRRRKICEGQVRDKYPYTTDAHLGGGWTRCCYGHLRKIVDCCSFSHKRINGDASLVGYCHNGRRVFCITYRDTKSKC